METEKTLLVRNVFLKFYNEKCREMVLASNSGGTNPQSGTQFVPNNFIDQQNILYSGNVAPTNITIGGYARWIHTDKRYNTKQFMISS